MPDDTTKRPSPDKSTTSKPEELRQKPLSDRDAETVKGGAPKKKV